MKNVIFLVCDGLPYDITIDGKQHKTPMPFLNTLRKNSIDCTKAFSQAPYTEAGIMGLMYGRNPLDNGAYLYGMQEWKKSLYEAFYNAGYEIFSSYFGSFTPPELMVKGHYVYSENYFSPMFSRYIRGKLDYYRSFFEKNEVNSEDIISLVKLLQRHFDTMLMWHCVEADENDCTDEFQPCVDISDRHRDEILNWKKEVQSEFTLFSLDKEGYLKRLFASYDSHFITNRCDFPGLPLKESIVKQRRWVKDEYSALFRKIKKKNAIYFLKNRQIPVNQIFKSLKCGKKQFAEHLYRTYQACCVFDHSKMTDLDLPQICTSSRAFIRALIDWNNNRKDREKPFFAYLHFDEFHRPLSFYSHDIVDGNLVEREMNDADSYVSSLPRNYRGNIGFDLAAQYIDTCIKELYEYFEKNNEIENTIFIITSDHGSSNFGGNVRFTLTNNFYPEQYHIPVVIHDGRVNKRVESFVNIKDIPATILDMCGINRPSSFTGKSILGEKGYFTFVEYLGPGVPDLMRRPVLFQYRDDNVAYLLSAKLNESENDIILSEYFDLKKDPCQFNNIVNSISDKQRNECINKWTGRLQELWENYHRWVTEE